MSAYRAGVKTDDRALDLSLEPVMLGIVLLVVAPFFVVPGTVFAAGMLRTFATQVTLTAIAMAFGGLVFAGLGSLIAYGAYRILTTRVRFVVTPEDLVIEWRRAGKVIKTEKVSLADVVDVAVSDEPSSGDDRLYGLVLGTRLGDVALSDGKSSEEWSYVASRKKLAAFLSVPER